MSGRSSGSRLRVVALVVALVVPLAAAVAAWQWQGQRLADARADRAADRAALDAATRETLVWATVDYRKVDDYVARVESGATGRFLSQFKASEKALRTLVTSNKSVQVPTIPHDGAGLICGATERCDQGDAQALVAMDATVTNKSTKTPVPRQYRLKITLDQSGGDWKIENLEFVDAQS
jgi:Mce-associated membrane protein